MFQNRDTIAAQATAAGEGGVAIVRVSGADCLRIISRVFRAKNGKPLENRVLTYGYVMEDGGVADEAMAVLMRAPHSYTREDVAEIHCHGSQALVGKILRLLMAAGARMAEPGEFTYRAFLNGRIDLAQAEGVMRMIRAGSERAMRSAVRQMEGGVSAFVRTAREEITSLLAAMAAAIDFPDEVEETQTAREVTAACKAIAAKLAAACDARAGRIEDEGLRVVLCGRPNAGKSSLLNALLGGERAIVTDIPGTTRDTLTEAVQIGGVRVLLTDTAGLRETGDAVERIGVERAKKALAEADVRALVLDSASPLTEEDKAALAGLIEHICIDMARRIASDGEGATHLIVVESYGLPTEHDARLVAKAIAGSTLFKAAVFGRDANWGRIMAAAGYSGADVDPTKADCIIKSSAGEVQVMKDGFGTDFSEELAKAVLTEHDITVIVDFHSGDGKAVAYGCDLTYDYVKINGDYRT